jgi:putative endonuclease
MVIVYAIQSEVSPRIYVGMTMNLERRLSEHNSGWTKSTRPFRPWRILYTENCENWEMGRQREKYLKSGFGKEFLKNLVP